MAQTTYFKRVSLGDKADQVIISGDSIFVQGYYLNSYSSLVSFVYIIGEDGNLGSSIFIEDTQPSDRSIILDDSSVVLAGNYNISPK